MRKSKFFAIIISAFLLSVVVIPIAINESYKHGVVYVTKWDAADVLSYYGSLLGSVSTILALVITIIFTKKQIQRDRFLELNRTKWEKVDIIISNLLQYEATAKTSLNNIKCYINPIEYRKIEVLIEEIYNSIMHFCKIGDELLDEYLTLQTLALEHGGTIPNEELLKHLDRATEINKRIPLAHDAEYQRLFNMKRDVFEKIYAEIEVEANKKLQFRK